MLRPMFPYYGSKWNISRYYCKPRYDIVIEPFAGSAGYSLFYGVKKAVLFDKDPIVVGVWDYLIRSDKSEIIKLPNIAEIGDSVDNYNIPQEAKWLIGFWLNRGSAAPKKSRTAYSARTDKAQLNWGIKAKERIYAQSDLIKEWKVREADYNMSDDIYATWFIDPPYIEKGKYYRFPFNKYDDLARWSNGRKGQIIVCEGEGAEWLPFTNLGDFKSSKGKAEERVFYKDSDYSSGLNFYEDLFRILEAVGVSDVS